MLSYKIFIKEDVYMQDRTKLIYNLNTAINKVKNFSMPSFNNVFSRQYSEDILFQYIRF